MLAYLDLSYNQMKTLHGEVVTKTDLTAAIEEGAVLRVRPIMMTVITTIAALLPIMWGHGTGSQVMKRIAGPMVGGLCSATILTLLVVPAIYALLKGWKLRE
jgi:Cu(I)/Ag(I) efflux system membrane protein CusA/SilA